MVACSPSAWVAKGHFQRHTVQLGPNEIPTVPQRYNKQNKLREKVKWC